MKSENMQLEPREGVCVCEIEPYRIFLSHINFFFIHYKKYYISKFKKSAQLERSKPENESVSHGTLFSRLSQFSYNGKINQK